MKIAPFGMDRNSVARKSLSFLIAGLLAVSAGAAPAQQHRATLEVVEMFVSKGQRFSCSLDVPRAECLGELSAIRDRLSTYRAENLGPWNWILVRSEDWKPLLKDLGARTDSPAMT